MGGLAILGVIAFVLSRIFGGPADFASDEPSTSGNNSATNQPAKGGTTVKLTYWGLWEPEEVVEKALADFHVQNPTIEVTYIKQSPKDYRERLQTAIAAGTGPDLFRFHGSWTPMLKTELSPVPSSVFNSADYQRNFYPVAGQQLQTGSQLVGIPLMYDGLVLYYNKEMLQTAGVEPPSTWSALRTLAIQLTVRASNGTIQRGGLAIGNSANVEHYGDILGLLMLQNGATLTNPTSNEARDALTFYTNFSKTDKVWDETLPSSTVAFARGEAAMMIAPSWRAHEVKALNPNLDFGTAAVPKLADNKISWATYWAEGVNSKSTHKDEAWKVLQFLSSDATLKKLYSLEAQTPGRLFGEPYSRVTLASEVATDPYIGAVLSDAPNAQGGFMSTYTFDNGLNDQILKYYADAITAVLGGKTPAETLQTVDQGTKQILRQYGISTPAAGGS